MFAIGVQNISKLDGVEAPTDAALRTLAVAYSPLAPGEEAKLDGSLEHELIFVGTVASSTRRGKKRRLPSAKRMAPASV